MPISRDRNVVVIVWLITTFTDIQFITTRGQTVKKDLPKKKVAAKARALEKKAPKDTAFSGSSQFEWVEYKPKEMEEVIINLANSGHNPSEIGLMLRDQYGIPSIKKFSNERLQKILERHKLLYEVPEDLLNLLKKSVRLERHLALNKKDMTAKRGLQLTVSKIRRLSEYYHEKKRLPKDWHYSPERAALLVK